MKQQELEKTTAAAPDFTKHLQTAIQTFRAALMDLLLAVDADPSKPQDLSRRFGLSKNLTWKISKVVNSPDLYAAIPHMPGAAGLRIFLQALAKAGAPTDLIDDTRNAAEEFDRVVEVHTGDRATLEIMISSMLPASAQSDHIEQSRKLAYQGNSGTWGVRAKAQLSLNILAPNEEEPDMADLVQVGGLVAFRRLRRDARWLLFRRERWSDDDPHPGRDVVEALDPRFVDNGVPLIGDFCSTPIPEIKVVSGEGEDQYELPPGPVGNTAALTCIYGHVARKVGAAYGVERGEYSEIGCNLITPAEHLVLDLLVHRDFDWAMNPEVVLYSRMDGGAMQVAARRERDLLSVAEPVHDLGWLSAGPATPILPRYSKLMGYVFKRVNWNPDDFRVFRFTMAYPPIPTAALLRSELPVRS